MSKTANKKREKVRARILCSAGALFSKRGFNRVSAGDIAEAVGMGRTTLYDYFSDKNEIFALHMEAVMEEYAERALDLLAGEGSLYEKLVAFATLQIRYSGHHQQIQQLYRAIASAPSGSAGVVISRLRKKHTDVFAALTGEAKAAAARGEMIADVPPEMLAQLIIHATAFPLKTGKDAEQSAREVVSVFWTGISARREC